MRVLLRLLATQLLGPSHQQHRPTAAVRGPTTARDALGFGQEQHDDETRRSEEELEPEELRT